MLDSLTIGCCAGFTRRTSHKGQWSGTRRSLWRPCLHPCQLLPWPASRIQGHKPWEVQILVQCWNMKRSPLKVCWQDKTYKGCKAAPCLSTGMGRDQSDHHHRGNTYILIIPVAPVLVKWMETAHSFPFSTSFPKVVHSIKTLFWGL